MSRFNAHMNIGYRVPSDLSESSFRGSVLSVFAMIAIGSVLVFETKAFFSSTSIGTNLVLHKSEGDGRVQLNFNITMTDLPCDYAAVDVFSTIGHKKDIVKKIQKFPIDADGMLQRYEHQTWHQDDMELWDPAIWESIDELHVDGEDAIRLNNISFPFALEMFPMVLVKFYTEDCPNCNDLAPTYEALGEIVTDTAMSIVDELTDNLHSEEEYEQAVNAMAPVLVTKLDCGDHPDVCNEQKIQVYPTIRVFVDGQAQGDYRGHRTVMELVHWLSHVEAKHRQPGELRMQAIVEFASERVTRNEEEVAWNEQVSYRRSPSLYLNTTNHPGCQLIGSVMVDEAPGKFIIHADSFGHNIAAHMTNLSHIVHHFSFGDLRTQTFVADGWSYSPSSFKKSLHPMDDHLYVTRELHQAFHHHIQVVTTEITESSFTKWIGKTRSIGRAYRMIANSHLSSYRHFTVPEAKFSYDLSPIAISYIQTYITWYEYVTALLAIVGGTFTVIGMMDSFFPQKQSYHR